MSDRQSSAKPTAYERAVRLLAQRPHFRAELAKKLAARGHQRDEIDAALERCRAQGYLDDEAVARAFATERQERRGLGRARVAADLRRRGAPAAATAAALGATSDEDELVRAREAARKWRRKSAASGDPRAALARHLDRKGFSRRAILAVLDEAGGAVSDDLAEAEPAD